MFLFSCCCLRSCLKATEGPNMQLQHKHCFSYLHISCHHPNKHAWLIKKIIIVPSLNNNNWILTLSYLKYSICTFTQHWIYWWINRCLPCEFTIKLTHIFFTCLELKKKLIGQPLHPNTSKHKSHIVDADFGTVFLMIWKLQAV